MKKIGLFGCGHLNKIVVDCYKKRLLEGYEIVGCYSKTSDIAGYSVVALLQNLESPIVF